MIINDSFCRALAMCQVLSYEGNAEKENKVPLMKKFGVKQRDNCKQQLGDSVKNKSGPDVL